MSAKNQNQARNFLGSEFQVNVLERIKLIEQQAKKGAVEEAPVLLGRSAFIEKEGAKAAYKEALDLYKNHDDTVDGTLLSKYASSYAGKKRRFEIRKHAYSNPAVIGIALTTVALAVIVPVSILVTTLPFNIAAAFGPLVWPASYLPLALRENYQVKDAANKAKNESLSKYPNERINEPVTESAKEPVSISQTIKPQKTWAQRNEKVVKSDNARGLV